MPVWYKVPPAAVWAGLEPAHPVQARVVQLPALAELGLEHLVWCNRLWELAQPCPRTILRSSPRWEQSIKQRLSPINAITEYRCCNSTMAKLISALPKHLLQARAFRSSSTTIAKL